MLKDFIKDWDYRFPLDRWWRKKYNVPFFSKQHLEVSQLNILLEWLEEQLFLEVEEEVSEEDNLFNEIDITQINI